jgi:Fe-S-cluster containining protein
LAERNMMESDSDSLKGTIELRVGEQTTRLQATLPRGDVELGAVLPVARQMTEAVIQWAVADTEAVGKAISCRAGCGACCRQAVPIGHAEARRLSALVYEMPEPRRSVVKGRFEDALARLREMDLLQRQADLAAADTGGRPPDYYGKWCAEYFQLKVACPFLEDESCSIHPERPLICREYLVTSPASECATLSRDGVRRVPIKASVSNAVRKLEQDSGMGNWMPLVMALEWTSSQPAERDRRPALGWLRRLQHLLGRKSETGSEPDIAPSD